MPGWFRMTPTGALLYARVTPNAGIDRVEGVERRDDGTEVLRVRVAAAPDRGKANAAVLGLLAKGLGLPRSSLAVAAGETARLKTIAVTADPTDLAGRFAALAPRG